ncbi:MAG: transcription-repair coupling factor [Candidatus Acidiferrales bacterium]
MILPIVADILGRVRKCPGVEAAFDELRRGAGRVRLAGVTPSARALIVVLAAEAAGRRTILLVESNSRAEQIAEPVRYFHRAMTQRPGERVVVLPAHDVLPYENLSPHPDISEARAVALWRFASGQADILIAAARAALLRLHSASSYTDLARVMTRDQETPLEVLVAHLENVGYERTSLVEMPGQYAQRGGILDVYSPEALRPVRLELLGDTLESIREFNPDTQRSVGPLERTTLLPLTDYPRRAASPASIGEETATSGSLYDEDGKDDALPGWEFRRMLVEPPKSSLLELVADTLVIEDEPEALEEKIGEFRDRVEKTKAEAAEMGEVAPVERFFLTDTELQRARGRTQQLALERLAIEQPGKNAHSLLSQPTTRYHGNIAAFMAEAKLRLDAGGQVIAGAASTGELERLADLCHEFELPYRLGELEGSATIGRLADESSAGNVSALTLTKAPIAEGFAIPAAHFVWYGNSDIFEIAPTQVAPKQRPASASFFGDFADLKSGEFVVHVDHGIGRFEGLRQVAVDGTTGEFMLLSYAEQARLYVPLARLDLVQKYKSLGGAAPALDRLGGAAWEARKSRAKKSVGEMAQKLLALYAERKAAEGHAFPPDSPWQKEFEESFEFEETPDQSRAIEEVKRDIENRQPMDRLLCGDVGYGKTEVAMRAAFKAVADSKQAAVLAPTTVLAFQHFETFRRRFAAFPMRIEMLSRFRNKSEQKHVLEALEAGKVDIIIGTHRLLSKDVRFHDLGLLVVDEEQRFGVAHKERIKEMRKNVHVLTMSATPIPRTLHMSLLGLRDLSIIETPPKSRLAIQTVVAPFSEGLIQRAIEEELSRQGQVFFVHNRVESIASLAAMVKRLAPKARVVIGHGQMKEENLEKVMLKFIRDEADVLVSTTIIENGLDIPRANTIIINRADRFGLAELYQLRGRVGRSNQRAYAYLLVPPEKTLSGLARERLAALKEFSELGAGFRIAALDLELRGAGNLLGREQHGYIAAVGFDMYVSMLERAVAEKKGEVARPEMRATLNLGLTIRIPPSYIENENLRLRIYKRIAEVSSDTQREEVRRELEDRFGKPPAEVENLLDYAVLKALAEKLVVASVERHGDLVALKFYDETPVRPEQLVRVVRGRRGMRLDPSGMLWFEWKKEGKGLADVTRNVLLQLQVQG